jgi:signal peptidase II
MPYVILVAALVILDQVVKALVRANIPHLGSVPLIPWVVELTYVENTGAAFSLLSDHTWLLTLISGVVAVALALLLWRRTVVTHPFGRISLAVVLAGAVGNLIDRALRGYVTDMFRLLFMDFAVFNVADICVVCGGIAFCIYFAFFYDKWEKGPHHAPSDPHC